MLDGQVYDNFPLEISADAVTIALNYFATSAYIDPDFSVTTSPEVSASIRAARSADLSVSQDEEGGGGVSAAVVGGVTAAIVAVALLIVVLGIIAIKKRKPECLFKNRDDEPEGL